MAAHLRHTASFEHGLVPQLLVSIYLKVVYKKSLGQERGSWKGEGDVFLLFAGGMVDYYGRAGGKR